MMTPPDKSAANRTSPSNPAQAGLPASPNAGSARLVRVFISSTAEDLREHRAAARDAAIGAEVMPIMMGKRGHPSFHREVPVVGVETGTGSLPNLRQLWKNTGSKSSIHPKTGPLMDVRDPCEACDLGQSWLSSFGLIRGWGLMR